MIENLTYLDVKIIHSQYETKGHSPLKVLADDFNPYVLKFPKNSFDKVSIVKEFICFYLLKCWSIPTPDIAALSVPDNLLKECPFISNRDKKLIEGTGCFGSKLITDAIELTDFLVAQNAPAQKRILNPKDMLRIALFDLWVENEDRRPTNNNIILEPRSKGLLIYPIDHAFTFSTLNFSELTHSTVNFSVNDSILHSPLAISTVKKIGIKKDYRTKLEEMFYLCIDNTKPFFSQIVSNIPDSLEFTIDDKLILSDFLFNRERNSLVWQEFDYILNSIL
jgi:hypothetical protein